MLELELERRSFFFTADESYEIWSNALALYTAVMWEFRLQLAHFQSQSQTFLPLKSAELHIRSRIVQKIQFVMMTWKK